MLPIRANRQEVPVVALNSERFAEFVKGLASVIGHADRVGPLNNYCVGLMLAVPRKSVEPMAMAVAPSRVAAEHQSLLHFVGKSPWNDARVLAKVREMVLPSIQAHGPIDVWIIDDTGMPKQGRHSACVSHQYCGQVRRKANCQVAVSLSIANAWASLPVAWRLYMPKAWADDLDRRRKAGIPGDLAFATKPEIALAQIRQAVAAGLPRGTVVMDGAYGLDATLRNGITACGLEYAVSITSALLVFEPGHTPPPGHKRRANSNRQKHVVSVAEVAAALPGEAWEPVTWREGTAEPLQSRFARVRIHAADVHTKGPRQPEWLLIEWPEGELEPIRYWLSTLPEDIAFDRLVDRAKMRWRIESDYHDLKQEVGLGHFEGRGWRGFHHHATLCIAAYGFLISQRDAIPPSGPRASGPGTQIAISARSRPRQSTRTARTTRPELNHHHANPADHRTRENPPTMSVLPPNANFSTIVTQ